MSCTAYLKFLRSTNTKGSLSWTVKKNGIKTSARKFRVLERMVVEVEYFCKEVQRKNDFKWESKLIYAVIYASENLDINSALRDSLI